MEEANSNRPKLTRSDGRKTVAKESSNRIGLVDSHGAGRQHLHFSRYHTMVKGVSDGGVLRRLFRLGGDLLAGFTAGGSLPEGVG